jgi:Secretion system C-terminal sorting domain
MLLKRLMSIPAVLLLLFAAFTAAAQESPVYFRLAEQAAVEKAQAITISWKVFRDTNRYRYTVERATDNLVFTEVETVRSWDNMGADNNFYVTDEKLPAGVTELFYRIRRVCLKDSVVAYSQPVSIRREKDNEPLFVLYPNPASRSVTLRIVQKEEDNIKIRVVDLNGRIRLARDYHLLPGNNNFTIDIEKMEAGSYIVQVFNQRYALMGQERLLKNN